VTSPDPDALATFRADLAAGRLEDAARALRRAIDPALDFTAAAALARHLVKLRSARAAAGAAPQRPLGLALLSNFTATQLAPLVDLFLFAAGVEATLYVPDYGTLRQEILDPGSELYRRGGGGGPGISTVILAASWRDLAHVPVAGAKREEAAAAVAREVADCSSSWSTLHVRLGCQVIQNNFDAPPWRTLANHETRDPSGLASHVARVNLALQDAAPPFVTIHDQDHLAATHGRWNWGDERFFHLAKLACAPECQVDYAHSLASLVAAQQGRAKKCLVLDLDNTLWGGVVGDDGLGGIRLGQGDAEGEAFAAFQRWAKGLRARGVLLAVCSKNDAAIAKEAFERHPGMVLRPDDIASFVANWNDKATNLRSIAEQLNLGLDSLVFVDDNPAERLLVRQLAPEVAVPELAPDPADYVRSVERHRYFQTVAMSEEDWRRADLYRVDAARRSEEAAAGGLEGFLDSLAMVARVAPVDAASLERSTQLINKSNQFNLTTRRYSTADVLRMANDPGWVTLTVSLADRFGDSGLISVVLARAEGDALEVDTWLMSCRVLKRGVEQLVSNLLCEAAAARGARVLRGTYVPTAKNGLVAEHYSGLGFRPMGRSEDGTTRWELEVAGRTPLPTHIAVAPG
jgi:FkbH-like protein